jgi:hypothetical protein
MTTTVSTQFQWRKIEVTVSVLRSLCIFVALAAVGLGIAMGILPKFYGTGGPTTVEVDGMESPTVSFILVRKFPYLFNAAIILIY